MLKKIMAMALAAVMAIGVTACGSGNTETQSQAEAKNTFIVGFDAEYPPYGYMDDNGEYVGFDLDLAAEVCERNGFELVKQPINWDSKDMELNSGSIDCIWNGFTMTGREDDYTWTVPYVDNSIVIAVKGDSDINTLADLAGKNVMVQADSSALAALEGDAADLAATFGNLEQIADYNTAFMNLESGSIDAIAVDIGVARYQVNSRGDAFRILEEDVAKEQYAVGFKKGNDALKDLVEATLFEMLDDGTFDKIANEYAEDEIPNMVCLKDQKK